MKTSIHLLALGLCGALLAGYTETGGKASVPQARSSAAPAASQKSAAPEAGPTGPLKLPKVSQERIGMKLTRVALRALGAKLRATGKLAYIPEYETHVTVPLTARVLSAPRKLGDYVRKGELLAVLDSPDLGRAQSDYLQAEAKLRLVVAALKRQEMLYKKQYAARKDYLQAQNDRESAGIEFERAVNALLVLGQSRGQISALGKTRRVSSTIELHAPISGKITGKSLTTGEQIQAGTMVYKIDDLSNLWALVDIHERDLAQVKAGTRATITSIAYPGRTWGGVVESVSDELAPDTHTAKARIRVANPGGLLKQEMFVDASIAVPQSRSYPAVPAGAVILKGRDRVVYVALDGDHFVRRKVEVGPEADGWLAIIRGLRPGELVVSKGALLVDAASEKE